MAGFAKMASYGVWNYVAVINSLPFYIIEVTVDIIAELIFKEKILCIWLAGTALPIVAFYLFIDQYV